ncbi:MAG: alpha/beta hydrolase [Pseudomonadales bacterium]
MNMFEGLDPELESPLRDFLNALGGGFNLNDIPAVRAMMDPMLAIAQAETPMVEGVCSEDLQASGGTGGHDVAIRIYRPVHLSGDLPALLWIHGGGYVLGGIEADDLMAKSLVASVHCMLVSVEYRLAPEHPFPIPLEDCYTALKWLSSTGEAHGVDTSRIAIGGVSAGGGLTAALALLARDRGEVPIAFQLLGCPMIDDRNIVQASEDVHDTLVWSRENNLIGWRSYLGQEPGGEHVSPYAAPFRTSDLTGLPPTYLTTGELDLFMAENVAYAKRLLQAGNPTELHVYPGVFHGFEGIAPTAAVSQRYLVERDNALKRAFSG